MKKRLTPAVDMDTMVISGSMSPGIAELYDNNG
jgi:hypothetical protein